MGQSSGSVGPAIGGSPMGGMRVLSPMDIARASPQYDPYTASRRPNYMPYGPNQQFYQPIYQPSYSQFSPMGYGQAPFGGFYQPPMMGFGQGSGQTQFGSMNFQGGDPGAFRNALMRQSERKGFGQPQRSLNDLSNFDMTGQGIFRNNPMDRNMMPPGMFGPATDISDQGQADLRLRTPEGVSMHAPYDAPMLSPQPMQQQYAPAPMQQTQPSSSGDAFADLVVPMLRRSSFGSRQPAPSNFQYSVNYGAPMLSPQPMQSQYRPISYMTQTQIDAKQAAADAAAAAAANQAAANVSYGAAGGKVHEEGIDSLLRK